IVELRSAGLSVNKKDSVVGLPALPVPIPGTGTFTTPEIAILKEQVHKGLAGVAILAMEKDDNALVTMSEPAVGMSRLHKISVLGIPIIEDRRNLPREVQD